MDLPIVFTYPYQYVVYEPVPQKGAITGFLRFLSLRKVTMHKYHTQKVHITIRNIEFEGWVYLLLIASSLSI